MIENFKALRTLSGKSLLGVFAYNDNNDNAASYGRLYTWEAAIEATPTGWHLPTKEE